MSSAPFRGAMVGREHQLSRIVSFVLDLEAEGNSGVFFLWAPPGTGKTRLVIETENAVPYRCFIIVEGDQSGTPFRELLEKWFNLNPLSPPEENLGAFDAIWDGLILNLGLVGGRERSDRRIEMEDARPYLEHLLGLNLSKDSIVLKLEPAQRAEKISLALVTFFDVLSILDPLVIVMENVQWFSEEDLLTVKRIMESTSGSPRSFIVTGRPDEQGQKPDFPETGSLLRTEEMYLDGLPESSIVSFVEEAGFGSPDEELAAFLWDRAGGIPLFLEQVIDYLSETGSIDRRGSLLRLEMKAGDIPVSIKDMFLSRMLFLPDAARKAVTAAAVIGSSFRVSDVERMLGIAHCEPVLETVEKKRIISCDGSSCSFSHLLFRDWIIELSSPPELRELNMKAGEILEKESEIYPSASRFMKVSDHYASAGEDEKAAIFLAEAAATYADNFENRTAVKIYRKLIRHVEGPARIDAELRLSDVYKNEGLLREGLSLLADTLERMRSQQPADRDLEALVMMKLGTYLGSSGRLSESEEMLRSCLTVFQENDDVENQAIVIRELGLVVRSAGRTAEAVELVERSVELARLTGNPGLICASLYWSAITYRQIGDYNRMKECTEEQVELAERSGILKSIIAGYDNLMRVHIYNRDYAAAEEVYGKLLAAAEKTANWAALSTATSKLGIIHLRRGEWESAMNCFRDCVNLTEKTGNLRAKCAALGNLAHASIALEDLASALKYSTELIDTASVIGFRSGLMSGYARMAYIFSLRGDYESALDCIGTQIEHAESLKDIRNLSDAWSSVADIQFKLNEIPESLTSIDRAMEYSAKADDMLLYSGQLALKGRVLFMTGNLREAEGFLEEALSHSEGRKGREKLAFRSSLYLKAIRAENGPELSDEILDMQDEAPDDYCRGEVFYWHWKLSGSPVSRDRAASILAGAGGPWPQPVLQRLLDDIRGCISEP